jgi:hypothetical protein
MAAAHGHYRDPSALVQPQYPLGTVFAAHEKCGLVHRALGTKELGLCARDDGKVRSFAEQRYSQGLRDHPCDAEIVRAWPFQRSAA